MRRFREDENELPYLVWETRDDETRFEEDEEIEPEKTYEEKVDDILNAMDLSLMLQTLLKSKVMEFLNSKDCTGLSVEGGFGGYTFNFTRENEYIKTIDEFEYYPRFANHRRTFKDCYSHHNYDNLISNPRFQEMIEKSGMEFIKCSGGYEVDYSMADDDFTMKDEAEIRVIFNAGNKKRSYKLDLDNMKLSEDYYEF